MTAPAVTALAAAIRHPAVRRFADADVPHATVVRLIDAARWTGSARNRQPWRFVEVRARAVVDALSQLGAYAGFLTAAPVVLAVAAADDGFADTEFDTGRVTQSLVLAAGELGLGSCPATIFPEANVTTARALLGLSESWRPRHLIGLGVPMAAGLQGGTPAVPRGRLPVAELLTTV